MVAVTVQVPILVVTNLPDEIAQPVAESLPTPHVMVASVVPPVVVRVRSVPYVPLVLEISSAAWFARCTVTVIVMLSPET